MSKAVGNRRKQKGDVDWGEIVACHAGYQKFSYKHIKPTHTGNLLIDAHNMTHLSGFPNFPNSDRTPLFFHRPTHPTETTLGVLFTESFGGPVQGSRGCWSSLPRRRSEGFIMRSSSSKGGCYSPFPPRSWEKNDRRSLKNVCFWDHCWRHQPG